MSLAKKNIKKSDKENLIGRILGVASSNEEEIKLLPENSTIKEIESLKEKNLNEEIIVELNRILKDYLKIKFRLIQSLTYEEIIEKLDKKKIDETIKTNLVSLLSQVHQKEYFSQEKINSKEINSLLDLAIKTLEEVKAYGEPQADIIKTEVVEEDIESNELIDLRNTLKELGENFKADWENDYTRDNYEKIKEDYSRLNDKEKIIIYPQIISVFNLKTN